MKRHQFIIVIIVAILGIILLYTWVGGFIAPDTAEGQAAIRNIDFTEDYDRTFTSAEDIEMDEEYRMLHGRSTRPIWGHNSYTQRYVPRYYFDNKEEI